ncbi:MAG: DUF2634 domain-containing protein [Lachnospirales bacterium]
MIPKNYYEDEITYDWYSLCSDKDNNYMMHLYTEEIKGVCNKIESMKQVIFKILNTEKDKYLIYSNIYGIDLTDLFGEPMSFAEVEVEKRVIEALTKDNRIDSVTDFVFEKKSRGVLSTIFVVHTIYGDIIQNLEVNI